MDLDRYNRNMRGFNWDQYRSQLPVRAVNVIVSHLAWEMDLPIGKMSETSVRCKVRDALGRNEKMANCGKVTTSILRCWVGLPE